MLTIDERRRALRFPLPLPLEVKWRENSGEIQKPATIRDISAHGVYFLIDRSLQPESKVELYLRLPGEGPAEGVLVHCVGRIARVEPGADPNRVGVGVRIDRYRFLRSGDEQTEKTSETVH